MKKAFWLLAVVACESKPPVVDAAAAPATASASATATATAPATATASATATATASATATPGRRRAKLGEMCGGIAGIGCAEGLVCKMVGPRHPDQAGSCVAGD